MDYLLDTHIFLWWLGGDKRLIKKVREEIENSQKNIYLSVASVWEMAIKISLGKIKLKNSLEKTIKRSNFEILNVELEHILTLDKLPNYHKDPFDRILVAQAIAENLILITDDKKIKKYKVETL